MRQKIMFVVISILFFSCKKESKQKPKGKSIVNSTKINTISQSEQLKAVDKLLYELVDKPQEFEAVSNKRTIITGKKGTVINLDPVQLESLDGSLLGDKIQIELVEMTDKASLLFNNAQTVSNNDILITGGAYYLNMKSKGKQLRIKKGEGLQIQFPKLTEKEMSLFFGEKYGFGQVNWIQSKEKLVPKTGLKRPEKRTLTKEAEVFDVVISDEYVSIPVKNVNEKTGLPSKKYLKELKEYEFKMKTYKSIGLLNFGWINVDKFDKNNSVKVNIPLIVKNDSLTGARIFGVFKDMNSIITTYYYKGQKLKPVFNNIPVGKKLTIIALSTKGGTPFIFEKVINSETALQVEVKFEATTHSEIKKKIETLK